MVPHVQNASATRLQMQRLAEARLSQPQLHHSQSLPRTPLKLPEQSILSPPGKFRQNEAFTWMLSLAFPEAISLAMQRVLWNGEGGGT